MRNIAGAIFLLEACNETAELNDPAVDLDIDIVRRSEVGILGDQRFDLRFNDAVLRGLIGRTNPLSCTMPFLVSTWICMPLVCASSLSAALTRAVSAASPARIRAVSRS